MPLEGWHDSDVVGRFISSIVAQLIDKATGRVLFAPKFFHWQDIQSVKWADWMLWEVEVRASEIHINLLYIFGCRIMFLMYFLSISIHVSGWLSRFVF